MAYCKICVKYFRIDNSGLSQVKSHEKCDKLGQTLLSNQRTYQIGQKGQIRLSKSSFVLTREDQVAKAEILQALHMVNKNLLFASKEDIERFRAMFPDSMIAKSYSMADTKSQYVIRFGIADYLTKKLI